jgi:hypothetical protein
VTVTGRGSMPRRRSRAASDTQAKSPRVVISAAARRSDARASHSASRAAGFERREPETQPVTADDGVPPALRVGCNLRAWVATPSERVGRVVPRTAVWTASASSRARRKSALAGEVEHLVDAGAQRSARSRTTRPRGNIAVQQWRGPSLAEGSAAALGQLIASEFEAGPHGSPSRRPRPCGPPYHRRLCGERSSSLGCGEGVQVEEGRIITGYAAPLTSLRCLS